MKPYLLDVNVLIALAWTSHVHHATAQQWFARKRAAGFRTCPITQLGFVRVSCSPALGGTSITPGDAARLMGVITAMPGHGFWRCEASVSDAVTRWDRVLGHRQITDAYLLGMARREGGILATLDRAILTLPDAGTHVELLLP